ncbi:hypothetical protein [Streptomyces solincola]|uniref:hypothetical protein n=1 Tax=Streptomyces solincola TaxID=2100817 RepID=UPI0015E419A3|nr:hypothetical protein [Streptomyces solincola]
MPDQEDQYELVNEELPDDGPGPSVDNEEELLAEMFGEPDDGGVYGGGDDDGDS